MNFGSGFKENVRAAVTNFPLSVFMCSLGIQ